MGAIHGSIHLSHLSPSALAFELNLSWRSRDDLLQGSFSVALAEAIISERIYSGNWTCYVYLLVLRSPTELYAWTR